MDRLGYTRAVAQILVYFALPSGVFTLLKMVHWLIIADSSITVD